MAIALFIASDDELAADRITNELEAALRGLAAMPHKGHLRQGLTQDPDHLFWSVRHYLVVYRANS